MLRMRTVTSESLRNLFIHNDKDLHALLRLALQYLIQSPFLVVERRSPQKQLRTQPPIFDINRLLGTIQRRRHSPEVIVPVDIPLDLIVLADRREGLETMFFANGETLAVGFFLVLFVVTMVRVDQVVKLADLVLQVDGGDFGIVEMAVCTEDKNLVSHSMKTIDASEQLVARWESDL